MPSKDLLTCETVERPLMRLSGIQRRSSSISTPSGAPGLSQTSSTCTSMRSLRGRDRGLASDLTQEMTTKTEASLNPSSLFQAQCSRHLLRRGRGHVRRLPAGLLWRADLRLQQLKDWRHRRDLQSALGRDLAT